MYKKLICNLVLLLLVGCAGALHHYTKIDPNEFQKQPNESIFNYPFDITWEATLNALSDFPILALSKEEGIITTDWRTQSVPFIFIMGEGLYDSGIIQTEKNSSYSQKRVRLNIHLLRENNRTMVTIKSSVEVYFDNTLVNIGMGQPVSNSIREWRHALSDNITEGEVLSKIEKQLTAIKVAENIIHQDDNQINLKTPHIPIYLNIANIAKDKYLLIINSDERPFIIGQQFKVIRISQGSPIEIGYAKVIQIKHQNIALEFNLYDLDNKLTKEDKLQY